MKPSTLKIANSLAFIFTIIMNTLANALPLGGMNTGELSALYPNLFVPAGFTFSIWGVIYALLLVFVVRQWVGDSDKVLKKIGPWLVVNCIANGTWIAVWHAQWVWVSMIVMLLLLASLVKIYTLLDIRYGPVSWSYKVPFSVYMGWISVATIANGTTLLVDQGMTELALGADLWASIMLSIAAVLGLYMLWTRRDVFFAAVIVWASYGIYARRIADTAAADGAITRTAVVAMVVVGILLLVQVVGIVRKSAI